MTEEQVLITGRAGFTESNLAERLIFVGHFVSIADIPQPGLVIVLLKTRD